MYQGYLALGGVVVANNSQTAAYVRDHMPHLTLRGCGQCDHFHEAMGVDPYSTPEDDLAPWYRSTQPGSERFYGLTIVDLEGLQTSTREMAITELSGDGAVQALPRHGSKEIRVRALAYAEDLAAMNLGMTWLRSVLDYAPCGERGGSANCTGQEMDLFTDCPGDEDPVEATRRVLSMARKMYRVEVASGPTILKQHSISRGQMWEVEFLLNAGVPFVFTVPEPATTTTGVTPTSAPEVSCSDVTDPYDDLVTDPLDGTIARPPRPPLIDPMQMPTSWNRYTMTIPASIGQRHGRLVPRIVVQTGTQARRMIRVRYFRQEATSPCDYEGEFLITYIPADAVLTIDGIQQDVTIEVDGREVPAGNLVIGSDGRPARWPTMGCDSAYRVVVDSEVALGDTLVRTDLATRE